MLASPKRDTEQWAMTLRDYLERGRRWLWLFVLALIAGGGGALLVSLGIDPTYASTAQITVNQVQESSGGPTYSSVLGNQSLTTTYARLVTSSKNLDRAAASVTPGVIDENRVSASAVRDTFLIDIRVTDRDPQRAADVANAVANAFPEYIKDVQLSGVSDGDRQINTVFISEPAEAETTPVSPDIRLNTVLGAFLGLLVAVGGVALFEYLDDRVRTREDVELLGIPFLGGILRLGAPSRRFWPRIGSPDAAAVEETFVENFRQVSASLGFSLGATPRKVIVVTSLLPGEGKTTVTSNLAWALSRSARRTLIIDGDLRRPSVHQSFSLPNSAGLTTAVVSNPRAPESVIARVSETLFVMTSGPVPPNPGELLASQRLGALLDAVKESFDVVLIDCPPMAGMADTPLWLARADGAVLVLAHERTRTGTVRRAVAEFTASGVPLLGTVLNFVPEGDRSAYGYAYGYRYGRQTRTSRRRTLRRLLTPWKLRPRGQRQGPPISPPDLLPPFRERS